MIRYVAVITVPEDGERVEFVPYTENDDRLLDLLLDGGRVQSIAPVAAVDVQF